MDALISVIIPIYNAEAYLERCLDSVINNTYRNLEIICVNDGSPDNCHKILERYAAQDSRIKVIWQENQGPSAARNTGMDAATGEYFYFLDSDDWVRQESFCYLLRAARETNADVIIGGYLEIYCESEWDLAGELRYPDRVVVWKGNAGCSRDAAWGTLYRRSLVACYRFPEGVKLYYGEDAFFNALVRCSGEDVIYAHVELPLYGYYIRKDSIIRESTPDDQIRSIKYWAEHLDQFENPRFAVSWIFQQVFFLSEYCGKSRVVRRNACIARKQCLPYLWDCRKLGRKQKMKMVLNTFFPSLYYSIIVHRDPTYKIYVESLRKRYQNLGMKEWEEL